MHFSLGEAQGVIAVWSSWLQDGDNLEHSTGLFVNFRVPVDKMKEDMGLLVRVFLPKLRST